MPITILLKDRFILGKGRYNPYSRPSNVSTMAVNRRAYPFGAQFEVMEIYYVFRFASRIVLSSPQPAIPIINR